jgi:hypothetical protein
VVGNLAELVKRHNLYNGHAGEVTHFRNNLDLDAPKFIASEEPKDVVSAYTFT